MRTVDDSVEDDQFRDPSAYNTSNCERTKFGLGRR